jgi:phenylacetaldehyde dehydrogenase
MTGTRSHLDVAEVLGGAHAAILIDGEWHAPRSGRMLDVIDPGTGETVGEIADADESDVEAAVASARAAFEDERWRSRTGEERARTLWRIADLIEEHEVELTLLECLDQGQPYVYLRTMVAGAATCFRYYAGLANSIYGVAADVMAGEAHMHAYSRKEPVGVVAMIVPWNAPLLMAAWKLAPMLAAGCTGVLKPAEETSLTALRLAQLVQQAGVPAGVVNVVTGRGAVTGAALAAHREVDKIAFTGSTEVGKLLVHASADNLKRLTLELGGKSPFIVLDDADLAEAIPAAAGAIFTNCGQVCSAGSRLLVADKIYAQVVEGLVAHARRVRPGYSTDPQTTMGPLISAKQLKRVTSYIATGVADGGSVVTGGRRLGDAGFFIEPTVLTDVPRESAPDREEIFGPVVVARQFADVDEALALANDTHYGLSSSVWSVDVRKAHAVARKLRAGRVGINIHSPGDYHFPSGGFKHSGLGREHGPNGLDPYLEDKSVFTKIAFLEGYQLCPQ